MSVYVSLVSAPLQLSDLPKDLLCNRRTEVPPNSLLSLLGYNAAQIELLDEFPLESGARESYAWDGWVEQLSGDLRQQGAELAEEDHRIPPIYGPIGWLNLLVQATPAVAGALGAVLGAWLNQKGNRKLRLKLGDREFEARNSEELQMLIKLAAQLETGNHPIDREARIVALAHELWVARGRPHGSPEVDWFRAQELMRQFGR